LRERRPQQLNALLVSGLDSFLSDAENDAVSWLHAPDGTRMVAVAASWSSC
jgi:hypothetical protein